MPVGITTIKKGYYRGNPTEEWSNHYHLTGADPADSTAWLALFNGLATAEKTLFSSGCNLVRAYGYTSDAENSHTVWTVDLEASPNVVIPGTLTVSSSRMMPGDVAAWIRWKTSRLTSKGKPVYLRKYYHDQWGPSTSSAATADNVLAGWKTAALAFGALLRDGAGIDGGRKMRDVVGPLAEGSPSPGTLIGHSASDYFTTRTLKRRPKRKVPA